MYEPGSIIDRSSDPAAHMQAAAEADRAANTAATAFASWSTLTAGERAENLLSAANALDTDRAALVELAALEVGAARSWTEFNVDLAIEIFYQAATRTDWSGALWPMLFAAFITIALGYIAIRTRP